MTDIAILELGKHDVAIYRAASDLQSHITRLAHGFQEQIAGEASDLQGQNCSGSLRLSRTKLLG